MRGADRPPLSLVTEGHEMIRLGARVRVSRAWVWVAHPGMARGIVYLASTCNASGKWIDPWLSPSVIVIACREYARITAGEVQSRSQPLAMARTEYEPGITLRRLKLPSRSLWSLRNKVRFDCASFGTSTTMAPATGCPLRSATPSTLALLPATRSET